MMASTMPADLAEIELGMTNCGHSIDEGFADALRAGRVFGRHAAWNFNGCVWFADGQFHEDVWRYHAHVATFAAGTLELLMKVVNDEFGWD